MKAKIKGIEVEGTPEELVEFAIRVQNGKEEQKTELQKPTTTATPLKNKILFYKKPRWTHEEETLLKNVYGFPLSSRQIQKKYFPDRTVSAVVRHAKELALKKKYHIHDKKKKKKETNKNRGYIPNKAKQLVKLYGYSYEKAHEMARDIWRKELMKNRKKKSATPARELSFPTISYLGNNLSETLGDFLIDMAKRNDNRTLNYQEYGYSLAIGSAEEWERLIKSIFASISEINAWIHSQGFKGRFILYNNRVMYKE